MKARIPVVALAAALPGVAWGANTLSGIVVGPAFDPLPNATVVADADAHHQQTQTDADGIYSLSGLPDGHYEIEVHAALGQPFADAGEVVIALAGDEVRSRVGFRLPPAGVVSGRVVDTAGAPVAGLEIVARGRRGFDRIEETDGDGRFSLRAPVGAVVIGLEDSEAEFRFVPVRSAVPAPGAVVQVPDLVAYTEADGGQITGEVEAGTGGTGQLVVAAFAQGFCLDLQVEAFINPLTLVAPVGGSYRLAGLPPDAACDVMLGFVVLDEDNFGSVTFRAIRAGLSPGQAGIDFAYPVPGRLLSGTLVDGTEPVPVAAVTLHDGAGTPVGFAESDGAGVFRFYNLPPGEYVLRAFHSRFQTLTRAVSLPDEDLTLPALALEPYTILHLRPAPSGGSELRWLHHPGGWSIEVTDRLDAVPWPWLIAFPRVGPDGLDQWVDDGSQTGGPPVGPAPRLYRLRR